MGWREGLGQAPVSVPFTPLGDRVVIKADVEDHAPEVTEGGVVLAKTLAAAVEGSDVEDSWFVGTIVALGPLVRPFSVRAWLQRCLTEAVRGLNEDNGLMSADQWLRHLLSQSQTLPAECPDALSIGDRVTFSWASGQQINIDGDKFLIMRANEVLAVLEKESYV